MSTCASDEYTAAGALSGRERERATTAVSRQRALVISRARLLKSGLMYRHSAN